MKKMVIFEPAMCCSTGICGPGVDLNLLRVSNVINILNNKEIVVTRYNLSSDPQAFVDNKVINEMLNSDGVDFLPATIVDGKVAKTKEYPTNDEFCKLLDIPEGSLKTKMKIKKPNSTGCKGGCC
ncbi:arsenite efflux transporter metallochaperone ArsD [Clostridium akagii]|uniref:arsenite efflux transporter metallochaperone ArsD n=1 Tax=Clostridium akagii TaxID=91623 RepID=UPI00047BEB47|nr:arsenite efflux transporter metallochaperone ArsD [Clostridium akagii]